MKWIIRRRGRDSLPVITVYFSISAIGLPVDGDVWRGQPLQEYVESDLLEWVQTDGLDFAAWLSRRRVRFIFDYCDSVELAQRGSDPDIEFRRSEIVIVLARDAGAIAGGHLQAELLENEHRELNQRAIATLLSLVGRT